MDIISILSQAWPWYVSGPLFGGIMLLLYYLGGNFGVSANLRSICSSIGASKVSDYFNMDWRSQIWNHIFLAGIVIGGSLTYFFLRTGTPPEISQDTISALQNIGINVDSMNGLLPDQLFQIKTISDLPKIGLLLVGGVLVGFGTRYAGGCTSGHAITGLSDLQIPSLLAVIGFFIGGLTMTHVIFPYIF